MHPLTAQRLNLWRLKNFDGERLPSAEDTYLFHLMAKDNPNDERFIAMAEVRDLAPLRRTRPARCSATRPSSGSSPPAWTACGGRSRGGGRGVRWSTTGCSSTPGRRSRCRCRTWPSFALNVAPLTVGAGLDQIMLLARMQEAGGQPRDVAIRFSYRPGTGVQLQVTDRPTEPLAPLDEYTQKVLRSRARGAVYPYELAPMLAGPRRHVRRIRPRRVGPAGAGGPAVRAEHGRDRRRRGDHGRRARYPEGMTRVAMFGDPTKALGTVAEAGVRAGGRGARSRRGAAACRSSGSRCPPAPPSRWSSGTENMDWVSRALRRIITFTQGGGEINVIVAGINVGAQPYWNAEATMLMHTKGILVMTPDSAMVLTGKHSLDYSGGVSAEDNFGIGGYDRVMGPNGQAQYWAPNLQAACEMLFAHYEHAYVAPGERCPRPAETDRPARPRRADVPARAPGQRLHHRRRHLLRRPPTRSGRSRSTSARSCGRSPTRTTRCWSGGPAWPTPTPSVVVRRPPRRPPGDGHRHRVAADPAAGQLPGRRAGPVDGGHAVPAVVEEDRPGDQRRQRQPAAGGAGEPVRASTGHRSRCASCSWSTAPRSAGPSSTSTGRSCSAWSPATTAGRSWCSPACSTTTWRCSPSRARSPR